MDKYIIYKFTNKLNGKAYIGKTKNFERRLSEHLKKDDCLYIYRAIKKYGLASFLIEFLEENLPFEEAKEKEGLFIVEHNTLCPNGYNLVLETGQGREPCKETRERMAVGQQSKSRAEIKGIKKKGAKFLCRVQQNKKEICKSFESLQGARECYDKCVLFLYGEEASLNFPDKREEYLKLDLEKEFENFKKRKIKSSIYEGVSYHKLTKKWMAYYYLKRKMIHLGIFATEEEAYNEAKKHYNEYIK